MFAGTRVPDPLSSVFGALADPTRRAILARLAETPGDLTVAQLYAMLALRQEVFVLEQACLYPDIDGLDPDTHHLLGWRSVDGRQELVAHLRENRTQLREEWARRITESRLLTAMTKEEIFKEATAVYDNYVEALESGTFEALQAYARNLSERIIPRGVETDEVIGIVGVDPHRVMVDMNALRRGAGGLAAVARDEDGRRRKPYMIRVPRIHPNL